MNAIAGFGSAWGIVWILSCSSLPIMCTGRGTVTALMLMGWADRQDNPLAALADVMQRAGEFVAAIVDMPKEADIDPEMLLGCTEDGRVVAVGRRQGGGRSAYGFDGSGRLIRWETVGKRRMTVFEAGVVVGGSMEAPPPNDLS